MSDRDQPAIVIHVRSVAEDDPVDAQEPRFRESGRRVFPSATTRCPNEQRQEFYHRYAKGTPVDRWRRDFCRTRTTIYRTHHRGAGASGCSARPIAFMDSPEFHEVERGSRDPRPAAGSGQEAGRLKAPPGLPPYLASLYSMPLLTREEEVYYFRKMNYLKFLASQAAGEDRSVRGRRSTRPRRDRAAARRGASKSRTS